MPEVLTFATGDRCGRRRSEMLIEEFRRPAGPCGTDHKAEIDMEMEKYLADVLTAIMPSRLVGEETGIRPGTDRLTNLNVAEAGSMERPERQAGWGLEGRRGIVGECHCR